MISHEKKSKSRKDFICFHFNKIGHKKSEYRVFKRKQNGERVNDKEKINVATMVDGDVCIICHSDIVNLTCQDTHQVVDFGASHHVTSGCDCFSSYTIDHFGHVKMGNDAECKIIGMGDVRLDTNTRCKLILKNVRHIPDIRLNLISIDVLYEEGYYNYFGKGKWKLTMGSLVIVKAKKYNSLYRMKTNSYEREVNVTDDSSIELYHSRLSSLSENGMRFLSKRQVIPSLESVDLKVCTYFFTSK